MELVLSFNKYVFMFTIWRTLAEFTTLKPNTVIQALWLFANNGMF